MHNVGYIGNLPWAIESIIFSEFYDLRFVVIEHKRVNDDLLTLLSMREIPYYEVEHPEDILVIDEIGDVDFFIMCSYGRKIPLRVIEEVSIYNMHFGELPYYKGRHPSFFATMAGELRQGVSLHKIDAKIDEGDLIAIEKVNYYYNENEKDLFSKMERTIPALLIALHEYLTGNAKKLTVLHEGKYYAPVEEKDKYLDIENWSFSKIYNLIRAQARYNGAIYRCSNSKELWIKEIKLSKLLSKYTIEDNLIYNQGILIGIYFNKLSFLKLIDFQEK